MILFHDYCFTYIQFWCAKYTFKFRKVFMIIAQYKIAHKHDFHIRIYLIINLLSFSDLSSVCWFICEIINNVLLINYFKSSKMYVKKLSKCMLKSCQKFIPLEILYKNILRKKLYIWNRKKIWRKEYIFEAVSLFLSLSCSQIQNIFRPFSLLWY